jgi:hypothetical protein
VVLISLSKITRINKVQTSKGKIMKETVVYRSELSLERQNGSLQELGELRWENSKRGPTQLLITCEVVKTNKNPRDSSAKEMAARGLFPGIVPFGYRKIADGEMAIDPVESRIVSRIFDLCVSGNQGPLSISKSIPVEFDMHLGKRSIRLILEDCFYIGVFAWRKRWYSGVHPVFIPHSLFYQAQGILNGLDRGMPQYASWHFCSACPGAC